MSLLFDLFWVFFKIGIVSFGGGYAMIPVIGAEISKRGWLPLEEFYNVIAISEVTPGAVAINAATYVGYRVAGFFGGLFATLGIVVPSLIVVLIVSAVLVRYRDTRAIRSAFDWVKPVVTGLILVAGVFVAQTCLLKSGSFDLAHPLALLEWRGIALFLGFFYAVRKLKVPVFPLIGLSAVLGIVLFYRG